MTKYITEDGTDFYKSLYESLDNEENENEDNLCLISGQELTNDFVKLECGHKFNYKPLFTEINNQKNVLKTYNKSKFSKEQLAKITDGYYIVCPYCRNVQTTLLPVLNNKDKKIYGINTDNIAYMSDNDMYEYINNSGKFKTYNDTNKCCSGICKKTVYNEDGTKTIQQVICNYSYVTPYLDKYYCDIHIKSVFKKHISDSKKELNKQELQEEKNNLPLCVEILKSGPNKGKQCCNKVHVVNGINKCNRHLSKEKKDSNL